MNKRFDVYANGKWIDSRLAYTGSDAIEATRREWADLDGAVWTAVEDRSGR